MRNLITHSEWLASAGEHQERHDREQQRRGKSRSLMQSMQSGFHALFIDRGWMRHKSRTGLFLAVLTLGALAACTSDGDSSHVSSAGPAEGYWRATEVVDGDTLHVVGPDGELTVRVLGINTPESGECFSDEATDALDDLVDGVDLILVTDQTDLDQFERSLRYVETADGIDVGAELVRGGYAISRRYEPDVARDARYSELQDAAQRDRVGLWASDACGDPVVEGLVIEVEINADAPGDDSENLNGEWVRFTSVADRSIDLKDWEVADESASHRYSFRDFVLEPAASVILHTGCGDDGPGSDGTDELFWCDGKGPVWNNAGDTVFLRDPSGNLVAVFAYGESL